MRIATLLLTLVIAACAPAEHDQTPEAGPQAGAASVDVGVNDEALLVCNDTAICSSLKSAVRAELNYRCGGGWSIPSGGCTASAWTATAPGGRSATATRISTTQRYVTATQCAGFTQACYCSGSSVVCD